MKNGFSLIELLCVLGLIGLLSTLAYPSYTKHLVHTRRLDGISALFDLATRLEQYHTRTGTYKTATLATGKKTDVLSQEISPGGWYQLNITHATQSDYQLEAIPIGAQAKQDSKCSNLTLDDHGHQGSNKACWE